MTKILHIAAHLGGGAGKAISGIISGLTEYKNDLLLLEEPESYKYLDKCKETGVNITVSSDVGVIMSCIEKNDIVVFNWWGHPLSYNVLKALSLSRSRLILWSHVNGLSYPFLSFELLNRFDFILFTSPCSYENGEWNQNEIEIIRRKSDIVYGMGDFHPSELPYKSDYHVSEIINIGYAGTLNYSKMNRCFPEICSNVLKNNSKIIFRLYGEYEEKFKKELLGLDNLFEKKVKFMGFSDCIENELINMDMFCYPLSAENFATTENSLIEAMAAGLPVIVLNNPAERSIVHHKVNGLIANNTSEFCEYIEKLINDYDFRKFLGLSSRKYIIENYSAENNVSVFDSVLKKISDTEKHIHDFEAVTGSNPFDFFINLCGRDSELFLDSDSINNVPDIYAGKSKGSPLHFLKYYYENEHFIKLSKKIGNIKEELQ